MKKLLLIVIVLSSLSSMAQYSKSYKSGFKLELNEVIPPALLGVGFVVNETLMNSGGNEKQTAIVAGVALGSSVLFHFGLKYCKENDVFKRVFNHKKHRLCYHSKKYR